MSKAAILGDAAIEQTPPAVLPNPRKIPVAQQAERSPISLGPNDKLVVRIGGSHSGDSSLITPKTMRETSERY